MRVVARGRVTVYDPKGEYQLLCEHMEPEGHRRPPAGLRTAQGSGWRPKGCSPRRKRAAALAAAENRRRHVARRCRRPRHHQGAAASICQRPHRHSSDARTGRRRGARHRAGPAGDREVRRHRRRDRRPRWRIDRRPVGVQRGGRGARDCRLPGAHHLRRRSRDRRDHRRLRRRCSRTHTIGGRGNGRVAEGRLLRAHRPALAATRLGDAHAAPSAGVAAAHARGRARIRGRARRGWRCVAGTSRELTNELRRAMRNRLSNRGPPVPHASPALETFDPRRRLGAARTRLVVGRRASRRRPSSGPAMRCEADSSAAAARLDALSPLAVLGARLRRMLERRSQRTIRSR